jgi:hypothetical protein
MQWDEVRRELQEWLANAVPALLAQWLDSLTEGNGGHHLGYSLLIDLRAGNVSPDVFCRVLETMPPDAEEHPGVRFYLALCRLDKAEKEIMWQSRTHKYSVRCGRIVEAADFVNFYYRSRGYLPTRPGDCQRAWDEVFWDDAGQPLPVLDSAWSGGRERVWVFPIEELDNLTKSAGGALPKELLQALGIPIVSGCGGTGAPLIGLVVYPEDIELETVQPTCLDANWSGDCFFVPYYRLDDWGRTCHTEGRWQNNMRERIHTTLQGPLTGFRARPVGEAVGVAVDRRAPLREALRRLTERSAS